jgi:hypothetical protein
MVETSDAGSHRGDPPVFAASRVSIDHDAAVHDAEVRVADEAIASLLQPQHEGLRPCEFDARENTVETGSAQVEVVKVGAIADDKAA